MCIPGHDKPVWHPIVTHGVSSLRIANDIKRLCCMQGRRITSQMQLNIFMLNVATVRSCSYAQDQDT